MEVSTSITLFQDKIVQITILTITPMFHLL